ncbi:hypothetical protein [Natrinema marinum]|uniref:hypothetical protein n=1 Tax=Natrinema marinum TaxID=2961598 RepID=UPI0020C8A571|nr:hypothetical protein [Natrinema marinum]
MNRGVTLAIRVDRGGCGDDSLERSGDGQGEIRRRRFGPAVTTTLERVIAL